MKKSKIIIPALAMLVMSSAAAVTGTVAWFSMNTTVTATGMSVKASGQGSLFITKAGALPTTSTRTASVEYTEAAEDLYPSTHAFSYKEKVDDATSLTSQTGLIRLTNGIDVNPETGTLLNGDDPEYAGVATADPNYFVDFDVYLSAGAALTGQDIIVNLILPSPLPASVNRAISVDFYGGLINTANAKATVSDATYIDTLNLASVHNKSTNDGNVEYVKFEIEGSGSGINIPKADGSAAYAVKMRVYYDGALIETGNSNNKTGTQLDTLDSGTAQSYNTAGQYIYDAQGRVVDLANDDSVVGYKIVNSANSVYTYARTSQLAQTAAVTFGVTFTAKAHDATNVHTNS